jgi:hypothetical protein
MNKRELTPAWVVSSAMPEKAELCAQTLSMTDFNFAIKRLSLILEDCCSLVSRRRKSKPNQLR